MLLSPRRSFQTQVVIIILCPWKEWNTTRLFVSTESTRKGCRAYQKKHAVHADGIAAIVIIVIINGVGRGGVGSGGALFNYDSTTTLIVHKP
jgi:hypothetical protein